MTAAKRPPASDRRPLHVVDLPKRFSNKRPALKTLIHRVLRGVEGRGPRRRGTGRDDTRGPVAKNPAKSQTRLTPERLMALVADYEAGIPVRAISAKYGVHRGTIPKLIRRAGVPMRVPGLNTENQTRTRDLYENGMTLEEVGREVGVCADTVRQAVLDAGGRIRLRGGRPPK